MQERIRLSKYHAKNIALNSVIAISKKKFGEKYIRKVIAYEGNGYLIVRKLTIKEWIVLYYRRIESWISELDFKLKDVLRKHKKN